MELHVADMGLTLAGGMALDFPIEIARMHNWKTVFVQPNVLWFIRKYVRS